MTVDLTTLSFENGKELTLGHEKLMSSAGLSPVYEAARKAHLSALMSERPDATAAQVVLMERQSYLAARIKQKEAAGGYSSEQSYTMANKTLNDNISLLLKTDAEKEDREQFQRDFMSMVAEAVKYSIRELDSETQKNVMFILQKKMEDILDG